MPHFDRKTWLWFYGIGLGALTLALFQALSIDQGGTIRFLDVGQGDSILIKTPEHHTILVDAGPDSSVVDRLGEAMGFFDRKIDLFVMTHPDRDHFSGILDVLPRYKIGQILLSGVASDDAYYDDFISQAKAQGIPFDIASSDTDYQIGPNLFLDVLFPLKGMSLIGQKPVDKNDTSVVTRLIEKEDNSVKSLALLTGDAETLEENQILASGEDVSANILKLGHHGSKYSTSIGFLDAVDPKIAAVSAGAGNKYGHPAPETLEKVKNLEVRRTDKEGTIIFDF
jgi:competence protein ComEC